MVINISVDMDMGATMEMLAGMSGRASNFRPIFWLAQKELELANTANFTAHGLPSGGWAPRQRPETWPIMKRSGALFSSLSNLRGPPNDIGNKTAIFGTNIKYAGFHQHGTTNLPKRLVVFEPVGFGLGLAVAAAEYIADGILPS